MLSRLRFAIGFSAGSSTTTNAVTPSSSTDQDASDYQSPTSFLLDYLGSSHVSEAQSVSLFTDTLKRVKKIHNEILRVEMTIRQGTVRVNTVKQNILLLAAPLYAVSLCGKGELRGFEDIFALNITRKRVHICHVFRAASTMEAATVVVTIAQHFRYVGRMLRECPVDLHRGNDCETTTMPNWCDADAAATSSLSSSVSDCLPTAAKLQVFSPSSHDNGVTSTTVTTDSDGSYPSLMDNTPSSSLKSIVRRVDGGGSSQTGVPVKRKCVLIPGVKHVGFTDHSQLLMLANHGSAHGSDTTATSSVRKTDQFSGSDSLERRNSVLSSKNQSVAVEALLKGDWEIMSELMRSMPVDALDQNRMSLLHHCVRNKAVEGIKFLLGSGANVNVEGPGEQTPLHFATSDGDCVSAKILLEHGANVRCKDKDFRTPLHLAVADHRNHEVSYLLLEYGARIQDNDIQGFRPVDIEPKLDEMLSRLIQSACSVLSAPSRSRSVSVSSAGSHTSYKHGPDPSATTATSESHHKQGPAFQASRSLEPSCAQDPVLEAVTLLLRLSSNPECHSALLANLCLPKTAEQIVTKACSADCSHAVREMVARLLYNLFNVSLPESRLRAVQSGALTIILDLISAPEPIADQCIEILRDFTASHTEVDYTAALPYIQVGPLLHFLVQQHVLGATVIPSTSTVTHPGLSDHGSHPGRHHSEHHLKSTTAGPSLVTRKLSRAEIPTDQLGFPDCVDQTVYRWSCGSPISLQLVALKTLAVASTSQKTCSELAQERWMTVLLHYLESDSQEIMMQTLTIFTNIASCSSKHDLLSKTKLKWHLMNLVKHENISVRYCCTRCLVYLGYTDEPPVSLFSPLFEMEMDKGIVTSDDRQKDRGIKACSVEKLVDLMMKSIQDLWCSSWSVPLSSSDQQLNQRSLKKDSLRSSSSPGVTPSEHQLILMVLTTVPTLCSPVIVMRLLIHGFQDPFVFESLNAGHVTKLSSLHSFLMRVWTTWFEYFPEDFFTHPLMMDEVLGLMEFMTKEYGGPYKPCFQVLNSLAVHVTNGTIKCRQLLRIVENSPHHNDLYTECQNSVRKGWLPCCTDDYIYLAGLQLYIEDLEELGILELARVDVNERLTSSRLKQSLPASFLASPSLVKRVIGQYREFINDRPSDRNAKHNFIDCCQNLSGYGCVFFKVRQEFPSGKVGGECKCLLGVSTNRFCLLDFDTKRELYRFSFGELRQAELDTQHLGVALSFSQVLLHLRLTSRSLYHSLERTLFDCSVEWSLRGLQSIDTNPWSRIAELTGSWGDDAIKCYITQNITPVIRTSKVIRKAPSKTSSTEKASRKDTHEQMSSSVPAQYQWQPSAGQSFGLFSSLLRYFSKPTLDGVAFLSNQEPDCSAVLDLSESCSQFDRRESTVGFSDSLPLDVDINRRFESLCKAGIQTCRCSPEVDLIRLDLSSVNVIDLLRLSKEIARQMTLIDHDLFCELTSRDVLLKVVQGNRMSPSSTVSAEKIAQRFNQVSNWVIASLLMEQSLDQRAELFCKFVELAMQCLELRNYNSVMAIVIGGLGSSVIKRLVRTREIIPMSIMGHLSKMEILMDPKSNCKRYRETLKNSPSPAVPYFGMHLKDLTFMNDGNPDFLFGNLINLNKYRQVFSVLEEIRRFQRGHYNFQEIPEVRRHLLAHIIISDKELNKISRDLEPGNRHSLHRSLTVDGRPPPQPPRFVDESGIVAGGSPASFELSRSNTIGSPMRPRRRPGMVDRNVFA